MEMVKTFQGNKHVVCENFRIATSGQLIHYIAEEAVKVWDLHLEENMTVISQNGLRVLDVGIVSETTMITTSIDANLRIWNCARKFQEPETKVNFEQVSHGSVQEVKFLPNPRYLLFMIGFGPFYWYVYDVTTCEILMELQLTSCSAMAFPLSNTQIATVSESCKLKIVNLETCSITKVFQGKVHPSSCFLTMKNGKEILTTSCDRRNFKVYDTETGRTIRTIQGVCQNISHISINKSESIAVAFIEGDNVLIVDLLQYKILHIMNSKNEFCSNILMNQEAVQVSSDGTLLILMVEKYLDINRKDNIFSTMLWNIAQEKVQCYMFDKEYHERYKDFTVEMSADVETATFMQEDQVVLSTHDDYIMRVFSTASGELQKRIIQHLNIPRLLFSPNENLPYFVSWVCSDEEMAFCLWRKETFEKIATFKLDEKHKNIALSPSGDVVIGRGKTEDYPITLWKLKNGITDPEAFSHMKEIDTFKKHGYGNTIKMTEDDDSNTDDDDDFTAGFGLDSQDV